MATFIYHGYRYTIPVHYLWGVENYGEALNNALIDGVEINREKV